MHLLRYLTYLVYLAGLTQWRLQSNSSKSSCFSYRYALLKQLRYTCHLRECDLLAPQMTADYNEADAIFQYIPALDHFFNKVSVESCKSDLLIPE